MVRNSLILVFILFCASFLSINSQIISINFIPNELNTSNLVISLPAYVVFLVFTGLGLLLGTLFEYSRTWRDRINYKKRMREVEELKAKINKLTRETASETDEILRLLK